MGTGEETRVWIQVRTPAHLNPILLTLLVSLRLGWQQQLLPPKKLRRRKSLRQSRHPKELQRNQSLKPNQHQKRRPLVHLMTVTMMMIPRLLQPQSQPKSLLHQPLIYLCCLIWRRCLQACQPPLSPLLLEDSSLQPPPPTCPLPLVSPCLFQRRRRSW